MASRYEDEEYLEQDEEEREGPPGRRTTLIALAVMAIPGGRGAVPGPSATAVPR